MKNFIVFKSESSQTNYNWFVAEFPNNEPAEGQIVLEAAFRSKGVVLAYFINPEDAEMFCDLKNKQLVEDNGK